MNELRITINFKFLRLMAITDKRLEIGIRKFARSFSCPFTTCCVGFKGWWTDERNLIVRTQWIGWFEWIN